MSTVNPLTTLYNTIWQTLESKPDFLAIFPHGTPHQVRYDSSLSYAPDPDQTELSPADYPVCRVTMQSTKPAVEGDSTTSFLDVTFNIEICTGQQHQSVARVAAWATYRAMMKWRTYIRESVEWNNQKCVSDFSATDNGFTDNNEKRKRGTNQWIVVWSATAKLYFNTSDLENL